MVNCSEIHLKDQVTKGKQMLFETTLLICVESIIEGN